MDSRWGQLQQAFRDTCIAYSERAALTKNGVLHGFERPGGEITEAAYGDALNQAGYGRRGTNLCMFDVIEGALSDYRTVGNGTTWAVAANPNQIVDTSGSGDYLGWAGRYVRVGDNVHFVQYVMSGVGVIVDGSGRPNCDVLYLAPVDGTYTTTLVADEDVQIVPVLLPFIIRVTQPAPLDETFEEWSDGEICLYEVVLFASDLEEVPPSYLLTEDLDSPSDNLTPFGVPAGSQLVDDGVEGHVEWPPEYNHTGPLPVYLVDGSAFPQLATQLDRLMCAGYHIRLVVEPFDQ